MAKSWSSNAKQLLKYLSADDVFQLASTTSRGQLEFSSMDEAVEAIIATCDSPGDLLRRKKLKREYLLRYVWEFSRHSDSKALPIKADKRQLIREVLTLWNCFVDDGASVSSPSIFTVDDDSGDDEYNRKPESAQGLDTSVLVEFAQKFLQWFYDLLNNSVDGAEFGAQHFFGNCLLRLRCGVTTDQSVTVEVEGGLNVAERLKNFVVRERLCFQPNLRLPLSFQVTQEPHGAVLVKSHGTTHRRSASNSGQQFVLGPYQQTFLVIEDPQTTTWKIQQTALNIKADISNLPIDSS